MSNICGAPTPYDPWTVLHQGSADPTNLSAAARKTLEDSAADWNSKQLTQLAALWGGNGQGNLAPPAGNPWDGLSEARQKKLRQLAKDVGRHYLRLMVQRSPVDPQGKVNIVAMTQSISDGTILVRGIDEAGKLVSPPSAHPTPSTLWDVIYNESVGEAALHQWVLDKWAKDVDKGQARLKAWRDHQLTKLALLYGREKALGAAAQAAATQPYPELNFSIPASGWQMGREGVYRERPGYVANVNLAMFAPDIAEDITKLLKDPRNHEFYQNLLDAVRRGVRSHDATFGEALNLIQANTRGSPDGVVLQKLIRNWQPGQVANDAALMAVSMLLVAQQTEAKTLMAKEQAATITGAELTRLRHLNETLPGLYMVNVGLRAEAGRALGILGSMNRLGNFMGAVQSNDVQRIESALRWMMGKGWKFNIKEAGSILAGLDFDDPVEFMRRMRRALHPKRAEYVKEALIQGFLTGTGSNFWNVTTGGVSVGIYRPAEMLIAGMIDKGIARVRHRPRTRYTEEAFQYMMSPQASMRDAWDAMWYFYKHGFSRDFARGIEQGIGYDKFDYSLRALPHRLGPVPLPTTTMEMTDQFWRMFAAGQIKKAIVYRTARKVTGQRAGPEFAAEMQRLMMQPTSEVEKQLNAAIEQESRKAADYSLWRQKPDGLALALMRARDRTELGGVLGIIGTTQLPFIKTPWNIAKWDLERTPIISAMNVLAWKKAWSREDPKMLQQYRNQPKELQQYRDRIAADQAKGVEQLAAATLGTIAGFMFWGLLKAGLFALTGAPPDDDRERERWEREGIIPYAIKIKGVPYWIEYRRIEGLNHILFAVSIAQQAERKGTDIGAAFTQSLFGSLEMFSNQTYVGNISEMLLAITDSSRYAPAYLRRTLANIANPVALLRQSASVVDPTMRQGSTYEDAIRRQFPIWSREVAPQLDVWGEPLQRPLPAVAPVRIGVPRGSYVDSELARLKIAIGNTGTSIDNVKLTRAEQLTYQHLAGQYTREYLESVVTDSRYEAADDVERVLVLNGARRLARQKAAREIMADVEPSRYPEPIQRTIKSAAELVPAGR